MKGSHWAAGTQRGLWRAVYFKKKKKSPLTLQKVGGDHTEEGRQVNKPLHSLRQEMKKEVMVGMEEINFL